ncbi:hypothetical protein PCO31010_00749 [Pandoraea commovens]|uniref:Uncharacterized protein n=1 Tax=Pandoraea commovens TaxID=2508289 RepID=A0A5E4SHN8_9BURK|nr:hypothetical protein PCO31010_00749 [Pandoraea commovens]
MVRTIPRYSTQTRGASADFFCDAEAPLFRYELREPYAPAAVTADWIFENTEENVVPRFV